MAHSTLTFNIAVYPVNNFLNHVMSYGADDVDLYRRAAVYVDKILKGAKPADSPVQQATKFEFVVNLKAAKQIGLTIPIDLPARGNKVIKNHHYREQSILPPAF